MRSSTESDPGVVLSRAQFVRQLQLEKQRADRSQAPLSLVVAEFPGNSHLDADDLREIVAELSLRIRATDSIGVLGARSVGFLLPYAAAGAAGTFSAMVAEKAGLVREAIRHATYSDSAFDLLARELIASEAIDEEGVPTSYQIAKHSRFGLAIKRGIDIVGAFSLLIIFAPLMAVTALAIKVTSPGPVIFRQARVGRDGVPFEFYKFRSMSAGADDHVHREYVTKLIAGQHQQINSGDSSAPVYKLKSDSRITPVGRIIRRTSVDELPQLFNVLKGDMSLVGPRPPIKYETDNYQSWHMRRLQELRPGITGLWQVEGRSRTSFDDMVRLDLAYIRNWSLWLDAKILVKTVAVVIRCDGAN